MRKVIFISLMMVLATAAFAYEPTAEIIKGDCKTSFVIQNPNKKWINNHSYIKVKISEDFTLEDFVDKEWHSLMFHRASCRYEWSSAAINDLMFITKENWNTITKQELYDLTFNFFKENTKLYRDAEKKIIYENEDELSEDELKLIEALDKLKNKDRTLEETNDVLEDMTSAGESIINKK